MTDKPLRWVPKCINCGKAKNQHQGGTFRCPEGKRTDTGYMKYSNNTYTDMSGKEVTLVVVPGFKVHPGPTPRLRCDNCKKPARYRNSPVGCIVLACECKR